MERRSTASQRPPAVPEDLDDETLDKASGVIELPLHIRWSGPPRAYYLSDRRGRARVYEQVLREGNEDDARWFIRVDELIELWDELVLPRRVRQAWADWLEDHRGLSLSSLAAGCLRLLLQRETDASSAATSRVAAACPVSGVVPTPPLLPHRGDAG